MHGNGRSKPVKISATQSVLASLLLLVPLAHAQQYPLRHYNTNDGLAHSIVGAIYQDKKGYIWFATADGLSRFDGYRFTNYGKEDGLPGSVVTSITEDREGQLWIGTTAGVARMVDDPIQSPTNEAGSAAGKWRKFIAYRIGATDNSNAVGAVLFDREGTLWCTSDEIYRASPVASGEPKFEVAITHKGWSSFRAFIDSKGRLWFGLLRELIEYVDGQVIRYGATDGLPMEQTFSRESPTIFNEQIIAIMEDSQANIFVANRRSIFEFVPSTTRGELRGRWRKFPLVLPADREIRSLAAGLQNDLWVGTSKGLVRYEIDKQGSVTATESLTGSYIMALFQDRDGNLWASAKDDGVYESPGDFIVRFTKAEGMPDQGLVSFVEGPNQTIYAVTNTAGAVAIKDGKVKTISGSQSYAPNHFILGVNRDSRNDYWMRTNDGLYRFRGPELDLRRGRKFGAADGAPPAKQFGIGWYEDPNGRIWCGALNDPALYMLPPTNGGKRNFERIPLEKTPRGHALDVLHCAIADRTGEIWFGWQGDLGRYRDGRVELIEPPSGLTDIPPRTFFIDSRGWLWVGTAGSGALMTKDPTVERPQFVSYTVRDGLVNDTVWQIVEDDLGRIYFSTSKGLDRLDTATGKIRHFTMAEGMGGPGATAAIKDRQGNIWVASGPGITKLSPNRERTPGPPPPVYFTHVQIAGEEAGLSERGAQRARLTELPASRNNLLVEFVGLNFHTGNTLLYQYKLEGVDKDWSAPSEQRLLNFARLAPGSYSLLVRSVNVDGLSNDEPSIMEFRILPPLWQRWWFVSMVASLLIAGLLALHRMRLRQTVAMERIRAQVATDLHDEVGSGLAQIAILSEVAKRESTPAATGLLTEVADLARSMRESMSDIVWAVDPRKDSLADLVQRMKQATFNLLEADGVRVDFQAPADREIQSTGLTPDRRRQLLLIFKEAITNVARHADADAVVVEVAVHASELQLRISDDGSGFNLDAQGNGHGLHGLQQRADTLNAKLQIESSPGAGTSIRVSLPLK
jgi:signal transduction histidine kinase/ligand-binding sensor domain-containing protein